jgi:hypothetical protein
MDNFLCVFKRKDTDNEAASIKDNEVCLSRDTVCEKPKCIKYYGKYIFWIHRYYCRWRKGHNVYFVEAS